jgi:hypothetical protein
METATLLTPRSGRSRFSKALPAPPPFLGNDTSMTASRQLPALPDMSTTMAFPPRTDSAGARYMAKPLNSPLPALPSEPEAPRQAKPIARKAVPVSSPSSAHPTTTPAKLKRLSSISSLLSAYSHTTSDSVQRSSHDSSITKASEPSFSPEQESMDIKRKEFTDSLAAYSINPYEEPASYENAMEDNDPLPPPPPLKNLNRPTTPRIGLPATPRSARPAESPKEADVTSSPISLTNGSPQKREIWKRRASSKSDRSLAVAGLKLAISHGSTAATAAPTAPTASTAAIEGPLLLPTQNNSTADNSRPSPRPSPRPPNISNGLPGRDIKPRTPRPNDKDEMTRPALSLEPLSTRRPEVTPEIFKKPENERVAPSMKDPPTPEYSPTSSQQQIRLEPVQSPGAVSPVSSPEPYSQDPAKPVARRPVGARTQEQLPPRPDPANVRGMPSTTSLRSPTSTVHPRPFANHDTQPNKVNQQSNLRQGQPTSEQTPRSNGPSAVMEHTSPVNSPTEGSVPFPALNAGKAFTWPEPEPFSQEQQDLVNAAVSRFPREFPFITTEDGVWPAAPLTVTHYQCLANHRGWLRIRNTNYPVRCMTCHATDKQWRSVCKSCSIRVCSGCADQLRGKNLADLDVDGLRKGKNAIASPTGEVMK